MNTKIISIIGIVVAFIMVIALNTSVYDTQYQDNNVIETFLGTGYYDNVSLTYSSTVGVGTTRSIEFTNDGEYLAVGIESANKLRVYNWNNITELYDPLSPQVSVAGLGSVFSVEFNDDDSYMVVGHSTSPHIKVYDVNNSFNTIVDSDLEVDGTVYDSKYYGEYLAVGGDMTNYLQVFKYVGSDYVKLSNNIDVLPTGRVTDIEYNNGYLHISTLASPYLISYKVVGDNLEKIDSPTNLPNSSGNVIETTDNGMYVVVGTTNSPYIKAYKFENEVYTDITFDVIPTQTLDTLALHFIDNSYLYVGGDLSVYKYKLTNNQFIQQVNDVTTFDSPVYVMDCNTVLGRFVLGDINDYELYTGTSDITFDNIVLSNKPDKVNSVTQLGIEKDYILIGDTMSITNEIYNQDIIVDYNYTIVEENYLLEIMPMLAFIGLILGIVGFVSGGGKRR